MTLLHSFLSKCDHKWDLRFKFIKLAFDNSGDFEYWLDVSFFEETHTWTNDPDTLLNKLFSRRGIKSIPVSIHPFFNVDEPIMGSDP
jgi:hypothetical protein